MSGPYDAGYSCCPCFWGREPSSLVLELQRRVTSFAGLRVLDAGCGEGKNAAFFSANGAVVHAIDYSALAIANGRAAWPHANIDWELADIRSSSALNDRYDIVVAYGILHCLPTVEDVRLSVEKLQEATVAGGFNVLCAFNDRAQDLGAHPGFTPVLLTHSEYERMYRGWTILSASDSDLHEVHPHNEIPHAHSMTRLLAMKSAQ